MCARYAGFLPAETIARIFGTVEPTSQCKALLERHTDERLPLVLVLRRHVRSIWIC
jgi:hypothetical protein